VLVDPGRSPYDLNFRLFGFPIRVHPFFWLGAGLFGATLLQGDMPALWFLWIAIVFVSILVHELGHAIAYRCFGCNASIVLYAFGGLAISNYVVHGRFRRIIVALAGPLAGFILAGVVYGSNKLTNWGSERGEIALFLYRQLWFVNFAWGIVNLLPVFPLDGSQVSREICEWNWRGRGQRIALQISIAVAIAVIVYSVVCEIEIRNRDYHLLKYLPDGFPIGGVYTAILFALLAYQSYQLMQQLGRDIYYEGPDDRLPWEK
jgi:stage IV sporulation protein FB